MVRTELYPMVYAVKHKDEVTRMKSRSGGIFTAVSDYILQQSGVVYGCVLTEDFLAKHVRADSMEMRNQMRGSKYIESDIGDTYQLVKQDIHAGRMVLFTGTSCQIAGLKAFLNRDTNLLICMDIVCHGVPSPKVWEEYLKWQEKRNKSKCTAVDFRNKQFGWNTHIETLSFGDKQVDSRIFTTLFYGHAILRPSCYQCPYKSVQHPGDITIADYWGIDKAAPGFSDNKGVSLVLINNEVGGRIFEQVKGNIVWQECDIKDSLQEPLIGPFHKPDNRERFWKDFRERKFSYITRKYAQQGIWGKIYRKCEQCMKVCSFH